jgi:UPF0755 protein
MKDKKKFILAFAAVLGVTIIVAVAVIYKCFIGASYSGADKVWIYVSKEMSSSDLANELRTKLGTAGQRVITLWDLFGGNINDARGAYCITPGDKVFGIYRRISAGHQTPVKLTFNNLRTMGQLAERVSTKLELDSASFMAACDSILPTKGFDKPDYIAAFLPDTYEFYWTATPAVVIDRLLETRNNFWTDSRNEKAKALGLTPLQIATVASIAEEETNSRAERGIVGRLYINRLNKGMRLQADPTVKFAVGDFSLRRITGEQLNVNSPYNTYRNIGLPPGPIRMPEAATIDSILNSAPHNYIYMCAKEDFSGLHNFATSFDSHRVNAVKYHKALNLRNIK